MEKEKKELFKKLFSDYCHEQVRKGNCDDKECEFCSVNEAYHEIFDEPETEKEESDEYDED